MHPSPAQDKTSSRSTSSNDSNNAAPYFAHERVDQINSIMRSQASKRTTHESSVGYEAPGAGFRISEFGNVLKGYQPHQTGEPVPGSYLWADMMLYELQQAHAT